MSTATHLGDRGGQRHVCKQAEAGGACSSEHCSCWSHAELCPSILRGVHPWDPLARPSVHPWWSRGCCAPTPPADVTSAWEGPVATHRRLPGPSRSSASFAHIYIPLFLLPLYGGSIALRPSRRGPSLRGACALDCESRRRPIALSRSIEPTSHV